MILVVRYEENEDQTVYCDFYGFVVGGVPDDGVVDGRDSGCAR